MRTSTDRGTRAVGLGYLPALEPAVFAAFADGLGDAAAVGHLVEARWPLHSARIELIRRLTLDDHPAAEAGVTEALGLLSAADRAYPAATRAVMGSPHTGAWSARCAELLCRENADPAEIAVALSGLTAIAAAAAVRAGLTFRATLPIRGGRVALPTLGYVDAGSVVDTGTATLTQGPAGTTVRTADREIRLAADEPCWRPLRRIAAVSDGLRVAVHIDPGDAYLFADGDVTGDWDHEAFAEQLTEAWHILVARHRPYAEGIGRALTHLVPLAARPDGGSASAASKDAFGAVAMTMPPDATACGVTLLHEIQHMKLNGILDLIDLYRPGAPARHRAPWRADARPVAGLLHGTYAFAGVADFWRVERAIRHDERAELEFCQWRGAVRLAADTLLESGELTDAGEALVSRLARRARGWEAETVPVAVAELARDAEDDRLAAWRLRNHRVEPDAAAALAEVYLAGRPCPDSAIVLPVRSSAPGGADDDRQRLRLLRHRAAAGTGSRADLAYLDGRAEAVDLYLAELREDADRISAWAGLALALRRAGDSTVHDHLELTAAVYRALRHGGADGDPRAVARWFGAGQIAGSSMSNSAR